MPDFQKQTVQWFPGHMAKTRRKIKESLPLVDAVVEIVDARIPESSRNPELDDITSGKPRIILLNKSDVADQNATRAWMDHFQSMGAFVLSVDCKTGKGLNGFVVRNGHVLGPADFMEIGVFRPDAGIIKTGRDGIDCIDLTLVVLAE